MELVSILIFLLPLALIWMFLVVPQQRRVRAQRALVSGLELGDEVMTTSGMFGRITELGSDIVFLEVAPGIELKFARGAIARTANPAESAEDLDQLEEGGVADDVDGDEAEPVEAEPEVDEPQAREKRTASSADEAGDAR
ncbi:MAG: preprotein translocase subunit YajC [Acidimicrobiales bacterium]